MTQDLTAMRPRHPSLYRLASDGRSLDFLFVQCPHCKGLSFPANVPGCSHCGAPLDKAEQVALAGDGALLEYVTLHVPLAPGMPAPSIAGDIRIADQVVEEGVIAVADESVLRPGMAMKAVAMPLDSGGIFDCRFVPANAEAAQ
ncbi:MAG: hypothetical protein FWG56_07775 [Desulfovibrionaceae bacterium]|nr:hypothetical protein [Desulfovibrionaceae bacterium]